MAKCRAVHGKSPEEIKSLAIMYWHDRNNARKEIDSLRKQLQEATEELVRVKSLAQEIIGD